MRNLGFILKGILFLIICCVAFLIIGLNSTFGNYSVSVYDIFMNIVLFLLYPILVLVFIIFTNKLINNNYFYLFFIPVLFVVFSFIWSENWHKKILYETSFEDSEGSTIVLFDNNSFEIRIQHQHGADYIKGSYIKNDKELLLQEKKITKLTDSIFTEKYISKDDSIFIPTLSGFKTVNLKLID